MSQGLTQVDDQDFQRVVLESDVPVLVDFWAEWCEPCKRMEPILRELAQHYQERVKVAQLNVERSPATANQFKVRGLPTFMLFKQGKVQATQVGMTSKSVMIQFVDKAL